MEFRKSAFYHNIPFGQRKILKRFPGVVILSALDVVSMLELELEAAIAVSMLCDAPGPNQCLELTPVHVPGAGKIDQGQLKVTKIFLIPARTGRLAPNYRSSKCWSSNDMHIPSYLMPK